ncbi:MAG: hypothetical protein CFH33_00059 [Alphaproteobacteria bacterium MarineAlpha9_Bin3]|nr:MAG: hypothetical protein CFH33_00059 [Alphaproteobacteria bacterium MarineAlpha9_Bin3]|tara:strand:- start:5130 stop:6074 length:945 start_codon:yes stop_codon:yes gene_type:complete
MLIIFIFFIILYYFFYFKIEKLTEKHLITFQNQLHENNINFSWKNVDKSGFPYRIVNKLKSVEIKINNTDIFLKSLDIIYQPWNIKHILIKTSEKIDITHMNNSIIIFPDILGSIVLNENNEKRVSFNFEKIQVIIDKNINEISKPEIYIREQENSNLEYSITIKELFFYPSFMEKNSIRNLLINGELINYKDFNINKFYDWFSSQGGLDIDNFSLNIDKILIKGNAFLGLDENLDIQSSISIETNELDKLIMILKNENVITKSLFETLNIIIKAIEISSSNIPKFSINIQNGYLSLMGIKIINIPNLKILNPN